LLDLGLQNAAEVVVTAFLSKVERSLPIAVPKGAPCSAAEECRNGVDGGTVPRGLMERGVSAIAVKTNCVDPAAVEAMRLCGMGDDGEDTLPVADAGSVGQLIPLCRVVRVDILPAYVAVPLRDASELVDHANECMAAGRSRRECGFLVPRRWWVQSTSDIDPRTPASPTCRLVGMWPR
jgi:hypothetical protein